jgi:signal transduction histidine kinase
MQAYRILKPRRGWFPVTTAARPFRRPRTPFVVLGVAWAVLSLGLAVLLQAWIVEWRERNLGAWFKEANNLAVRLTQEWEHWTVAVPRFRTGDEPVVREWIRREPLVTALVDSRCGRVWIKDGERLRPASVGEGRQPADWAWRAMQVAPVWVDASPRGRAPVARSRDGREDLGTWWLTGLADPENDRRCSIVTFQGPWCLVKVWDPRGPEPELWLRGTLGSGAGYRFGLVCSQCLKQPRYRSLPFGGYGRGDAGAGNPLFVDPAAAPFQVDRALSESFGGNWEVVLQMAPESYRAFRRSYHARRNLVWASYLLLVAASGLALGAVLFARKREQRIADRLASLTHSLKTPLALLKLRCETVLNPDLPDQARETRLLEIRAEADHLGRTIESCLEEMRDPCRAAAAGRVDPAFFDAFDEATTPAFRSRGRLLEVYVGDFCVPCSPVALEAALHTLVENALDHGKGRVEVKATVVPGLLRITVADEGDGIPGNRLQELRKGHVPPAPPRRPGHGLGLAALVNLARQEGWGLAFAPTEGTFTATLEIPLRPSGA